MWIFYIKKGLVIGVYQKEGDKDPKLTTSGEKFDDRVQGKVSELIKEWVLVDVVCLLLIHIKLVLLYRCNISGQLGKGKVFNNIDQEYRSVAVIGLGREGAGFNELEMIDEGMVSKKWKIQNRNASIWIQKKNKSYRIVAMLYYCKCLIIIYSLLS